MIPRGIRNNNPLNLRKGQFWKGLAPVQNDPEFCQFTSMVWGVRAGFRCLRTYIVQRKLNTISLIISKWAPSTENNTEAYIQRVVQFTGVADNFVISYYDRELMMSLFNAMAKVEVGRGIDLHTLTIAYNLV